MRITTLVYGISYLILAGLAFFRHDVTFARDVLIAGLSLTAVFGVADVASTWGTPARKSTMEMVIESLASKN